MARRYFALLLIEIDARRLYRGDNSLQVLALQPVQIDGF